MKNLLIGFVTALVLAAGLWLGLSRSDARWAGVDETVVAKLAEQAGRPPQRPIIGTDRGDLPLFFFLVAGAVGGFVGGYYFRGLFTPALGRDSTARGRDEAAG